MRLFGRNKKKQGTPAPATSTVVVTYPTIQVHTNRNTTTNMRKEPLLSPREQQDVSKVSACSSGASSSPHNDIEATATSSSHPTSNNISQTKSNISKTPSVALSRTPSGMTECSETLIYAELPAEHGDVSKPPVAVAQPQQPWYKTKVGMATALLFLVGLTAIVSVGRFLEEEINYKQKNVAFIGNSNFFVNDLPRLMEALAQGKIFQDSCLHSKGSIMNILQTGNGMYQRWQTDAAALVLDDDDHTSVTWVNEDGETTPLYDYGACSVPQLLIGQDEYLAIGGYDDQDDTNPCLQSEGYMEYMESFNYSSPWDFVILTDQSKRMCYPEAREEALLALNYTYIPILEHTSGIPIIVQPHGFYSESVNKTGLGDVPTFTAKIYNGALEYAEFMQLRLPDVRIAPVGMAFLTVYEQDMDLWYKLFLSDGIHPSPSGTFLYGCVIYATMYKHMPKSSVVLVQDMSTLWSKARKLQSNEFPEQAEAEYLMGIARQVTIKGIMPSSLPFINMTDYDEEDQEENEDEDEDTWTEDYDGWYDYSNQVSWDNAQYSNNYQNGDYNANANGEYAN
jgi:hypothetical protein